MHVRCCGLNNTVFIQVTKLILEWGGILVASICIIIEHGIIIFINVIKQNPKTQHRMDSSSSPKVEAKYGLQMYHSKFTCMQGMVRREAASY